MRPASRSETPRLNVPGGTSTSAGSPRPNTAVSPPPRVAATASGDKADKGEAPLAKAPRRLREELEWLRRQVGSADTTGQMPEAIAEYTKWSLEGVEPVSKHAAIFTYTSKDRKRGTPHPRGRGRVPRPITWHTTLLAEVGANDEGPLPWIERDYTPISSAHQWEQGRVEILIKIYADGKATSWLYRTKPETVWLSRPVRTLAVPSLVHDDGPSFRPASQLVRLRGGRCWGRALVALALLG